MSISKAQQTMSTKKASINNYKKDLTQMQKQYMQAQGFKTKNSCDIKLKLVLFAKKNIDRKQAVDRIFKYINFEPIAQEIEKGLFEFVLLCVTLEKFQDHFVNIIYNDQLENICGNLDTSDENIDNQTLLPTILQQNFNPYFVAFLSPEQIHPKRWAEIIIKKQIENDTINNLQTTDMYQCKKCKERKFKLTRLQLRCADESESVFYTCLVCYNSFIR